jgi:hypothetical protein
MSVKKLCCQGCGADLEVDESIRFVSCNYCGARLEIVRDASTTHSRLLDRIERRTGEMAGDLRVIRLQNDLEQLDREWQSQRSKYLVTNKRGEVSEPSTAGAVIGGLIAAGFGIFWTISTSSMGAPGIFPLFGLVFVVFAVFGIASSVNKSGALKSGEMEYQTKRSRLLAQIESAKSER